MKSIIISSKTVQDAIKEGVQKLNVDRDRVSIEILEEPNKGFLGFIGSKDAKVKITVKNDPKEQATNFLNTLLEKMEIKADIRMSLVGDILEIEVIGENSEDMGAIIGKRGNTLDSIQYIISLIVNKDREEYLKVLLDTENYRKKREETLIRLAKKMAGKAKRTRKKIRLESMNPYERRIIHFALQSDPYIKTFSEGKEPNRKVVIDIK
ncbi:RNA-binding cell elongation regulator Jag/EloR [Senegalia massiliensis]|uniref:RNA-binding protein KhpB n=1 Tax=Senegalia massiliensis TaxID=1720316 RepID=A0A845R1H4_9CLOT|nr:RNA-binding cell elongation regulator Jag/EloR [Senegalia massiliensis]NBI08114.1 protein jag [Senegalia massiliensis]